MGLVAQVGVTGQDGVVVILGEGTLPLGGELHQVLLATIGSPGGETVLRGTGVVGVGVGLVVALNPVKDVG